MAATTSIRVIPWTAAYREFFRLMADDWTPPAVMQTVASAARDRLTVRVTCTKPDGMKVRLVTRLRRAGGGWEVESESLDLKLTFRPGAVA